MCSSISALKSVAFLLRRNMALASLRLEFEDPPDCCCEPLPFRCLFGELFTAIAGQRVKAGLAVLDGGPPFGGDPSALFQTLQRGIECAVLDQQLFFCGLLDGPGYSLPML